MDEAHRQTMMANAKAARDPQYSTIGAGLAERVQAQRASENWNEPGDKPASLINQATSRINFLASDAARIRDRLQSLGDRAFGPAPVAKEDKMSEQAGPRGAAEGLSRAIDTLTGILGQIEEAETRIDTLA